ncbi:MAG: molecular chaperone [Thermodesulfovibrionales bacterium]
MEGNNVCLSQGRCETEDMGMSKEIRIQNSRFKIQNAEVAFSRSTVYELLSHCYGEPGTEFLDFIKNGEFFEHMTKSLRFHPELKDGILQSLYTLIDETMRMEINDLLEEYCFIVSPEKNLLYEGNYLHPFNSYEEMADIAGFYRAFGFDFDGERPDHLSLELEFMRILSLKEAMALQEGDQEKLDVTTNAERKFLSSHIGRWTEALLQMTKDIPFYSTLSRLLKEWIEMECDLYSVKIDRIFYFNRPNENDKELCLKEGSDERF